MNKHDWLEYKNWAVIGASTRKDSYGHMIAARLMKEGYNMIPISNKYSEIEGVQAYTSLLNYDGDIDVVDFVVNPSIGIHVLDEVVEKGIKRIMLQPGTSSDALMKKAEENGVEVLQSCVLVMLSWR